MTDTPTAQPALTADQQAALDERRLARKVAVGLPLFTFAMASAATATFSLSIGLLVLAAGLLLGVIALVWASLRVLSGDVALPDELDVLERRAVDAYDALLSRKQMLIVALKDLEGEHQLGKLDDRDFHDLSTTYREDLKAVLKQIDAELSPYRARAEKLAAAHLAKVGITVDAPSSEPAETTNEPAVPRNAARVECADCHTTNESDARFCKKCGADLATPSESSSSAEADSPPAESQS